MPAPSAKRKKGSDSGPKVQVTLSKFFTSSEKVKKSTKTIVSTDKKDDFQITEDTSSRKRTAKEKDTTNVSPKSKKSRPLDVSAEESRKEKNGCFNSVASTSSSKCTPVTKKLQQYSLEKHELSEVASEQTIKSKDCPFIDFTSGGDVATTVGNTNSDDEEDSSLPHSSNNTSSTCTRGQNDSETLSLNHFRPNKGKKFSPAVKFTPLEQQYVDIKAKYPDAILFVECGYKYRFFGDDAEVAAKVLKIFCHPDHNFMTASIPVHRLFVHVRRLVASGYKVGVVKQTETAHLKKAGDNKSGPFSRKLSALYTKSTLIGEDVDPLCETSISGVETSSSSLQPNNYLMSVYEQRLESSNKTSTVGMVCVDPATGDVIFDSFQDGSVWNELETRIVHLQPVEILLSSDASESMGRIVSDWANLSSNREDKIRLEKMRSEDFIYTQAFATVSDFYREDQSKLQTVLKYEKPVISCLAALIVYLQDFHLDRILSEISNFRQFSLRSHFMHLTGQCVHNLELFTNTTDGSEKGSLFGLLNYTCTKFGSRLLRRWIAQPLLDVNKIQERQDAIEELRGDHFPLLKKVQDMMRKLPDLERGLCSIYHAKCSALEFYSVTKALEKLKKGISEQYQSAASSLHSSLLTRVMIEIPELLSDILIYSSVVSEKAARENDKTNLFADDSQFPVICERKKEIEEVICSITDHRRDVRLTLKQPGLNYVTVQQIEFLIEVKNTLLKSVPSDWTQISSTKLVSRFHSPFIVKQYQKLNQLREQLVADVTKSWQQFLQQFSSEFAKYKKAIDHLAALDCLMSLSKIASQDSFCRPQLDEHRVHIEIEQGRHPIIDALRGEQEQFVPNNTALSENATRVMVISGPNMGGKSSYIRQVALLTIMAQIGSYVPAQSALMGITDAIYTRMGASDEIFKGQSTFMLELQEASEIMTQATERSLVILDELGRGTSTHDGVAIAHATLHHFITKCRCLVLFVTHFPMMSEFQDEFPDAVRNYHMAFLVHDDNKDNENDSEAVTFLYELTEGAAKKSYGLNVARLADIPNDIIHTAAQKSRELETTILQRIDRKQLIGKLWHADHLAVESAVKQVQNL